DPRAATRCGAAAAGDPSASRALRTRLRGRRSRPAGGVREPGRDLPRRVLVLPAERVPAQALRPRPEPHGDLPPPRPRADLVADGRCDARSDPGRTRPALRAAGRDGRVPHPAGATRPLPGVDLGRLARSGLARDLALGGRSETRGFLAARPLAVL